MAWLTLIRLYHLVVITLISSSTAKVVHLHGQFNTVRSTNYPSDYESNESRTWIVDRIRDDVCVYTVEILSIKIQPSPGCQKDYLQINGQKFCGVKSGDLQFTVRRGENLLIKFESDATVQDTGFAIFVQQNRFTCTDAKTTTRAASTAMTTSGTGKPNTIGSSGTPSWPTTTTSTSTENVVSSTTSPVTPKGLCVQTQLDDSTQYLTYPGGKCKFNIGYDPRLCSSCWQYAEVYPSAEHLDHGPHRSCHSWIFIDRKICYGSFAVDFQRHYRCRKFRYVTVRNDIRNKLPKMFQVMTNCEQWG